MGTTVRYVDEFGRDELNTEEGSLWGSLVDARLSILFAANASFLYTPDQVSLATTGGSGFRFSGQFSVDSISTGTDLAEFSELQGTVSKLTDLSEVDGELFDRFEIDFLEPITLNELVFGSTWSTLLEGDDSLVGGDGVDYLFAYGGDDVITSGLGADVINGGSGLDRVVYASQRLSIQQTNSGYIVGDDTLINVERLEFTDVSVALDTEGSTSAGAGYRLYKAAFDRTPDEEGLGYWINELDQGFALHQVANSFVISQEFKNLYGADLNNEGFITALYNNVLDRDPDQGGLDYWINDMENNGMSRADVLASFSESAENIANTDPLIELGVVYQPYGDALVG